MAMSQEPGPEADLRPTPGQEPPAPPPLGQRLAALLDERRPLYSQADLRVTQGDEPPEVVARRVIEALPTILRTPPVPPQGPITLADGTGQARASLN